MPSLRLILMSNRHSKTLNTLSLVILLLVGTPSILEAQNEADEAFFRASKIYEYGRNQKDYYESRSALRTAELSFRNYLQNHGGHKDRQTAYYRMAVSQLLTGNIDSAEANFEFIIKKYKTGQLVAASAYRLGTQRYNEENYKSAEKYYKLAAQQSEKPAVRQQALYLQARCLMLSGSKEKALQPLRRLVNEKESSYQDTSRLALAHILFELSEFKEALMHFDKLANNAKVAPDIKVEALLYTGITNARLGNQEKAEEIIAKTIDTPGIKNDYKAKAQSELYQIYFDNDNLDALIDNYQKGVYPSEPIVTSNTYLLAGYALLKKDYFQRAITAFTSVERLVPNSALSFEASFRRLYCFYRLDGANVVDQADAFKEIYGSYQKKNEWHKLIGVFKAESLLHSGMPEEAAKVYRSIDSKDLPSTLQANFLFKKLVCLSEAEDYAGCINAAGHFIDDFPAHDLAFEVHIRRGNAYLSNNNYASALNDFQKVLKESSGSALAATALQGMIKVYRRERNYDELITASQLLLQKFPGLKKAAQAHAHYWMGWGYFKQEKFAECIPEFNKARNLDPSTYKEPAGTRVFLSSYYLQDADIMKEAFVRMKHDVPGKYFPPRILAWFGIQRFQKEDYKLSTEVLDSIANREEPLETPIDVWRYLTKSSLETKQYEKAEEAVNYVLEREEDSFWKTDALLDKSQALLGLDKVDQAIAVAEEALFQEPRGTIEAGLKFVIAEGRLRKGEKNTAKDIYLLVADKFKGDETIRPYALWKAIEILKIQENPVSSSMLSALREEFPEWKEPNK